MFKSTHNTVDILDDMPVSFYVSRPFHLSQMKNELLTGEHLKRKFQTFVLIHIQSLGFYRTCDLICKVSKTNKSQMLDAEIVMNANTGCNFY